MMPSTDTLEHQRPPPVLSACAVPGCGADPFPNAFSLARHVLVHHLGAVADAASDEQRHADLRLVLRRVECHYSDLQRAAENGSSESGGSSSSSIIHNDTNSSGVLDDLLQQVLACVNQQPERSSKESDREDDGVRNNRAPFCAVTFNMPRPARDVTVASALSALAQDSPAHSTPFGFSLAFGKTYPDLGIRSGMPVTTPLLRLVALVQHETATDHATLSLRVEPNVSSEDVAPAKDLDAGKVRPGRAGVAGFRLGEPEIDVGLATIAFAHSSSTAPTASEHDAFVWMANRTRSDDFDDLALLRMCDRIPPQPSLVVPRRRTTDGRLLCLPHLSGLRHGVFGYMTTLDRTVKVIIDVVSALTSLHAAGVVHGSVDRCWCVAEVCVGTLFVNPATATPLGSVEEIVEDRRLLVRSLDDVPCLQGRPEVFRTLDAFVNDVPKPGNREGDSGAAAAVTVDALTLAALLLDESLRKYVDGAAVTAAKPALSARTSGGFMVDGGLD